MTLSDVAREAGVSVATASRAFNGSTNRTVGEDLRERVATAAARLGYHPDTTAQAMARGRANSIGLIVHDIADPYFSTIASGVIDAADRSGLAVTVASTQHDVSRESTLVALMRHQRARALILAGSRTDETAEMELVRGEVEQFLAAGGTVTLIGQPVLGVDTVVIENRAGAASLAFALHRLGYRRFAVLAGPPQHLTARDRAMGFVAALAALSVPVPPENVVSCAFTRDGGHSGMRTLLESGSRPEVVFAVNDVMALGAMAAIHEVGLRIPDDVAIAGFDDIVTVRDVTPPLTSVSIPLTQVGTQALTLALAKPQPEPRMVSIPTEVVLRASTPNRR